MHGGNLKEVKSTDKPSGRSDEVKKTEDDGALLGEMAGVETASDKCTGVEVLQRYNIT